MRKTLILAATAAIAGVMIAGCGSSKVQQHVSDGEKARIDSEAKQFHSRTDAKLNNNR
jgi:hypothetical protein